ncbi:MAG: hypothetical protein JWO60_3437 [Frankiales bacterium]|nr:hypothetical protein [Frankiales bacterium]
MGDSAGGALSTATAPAATTTSSSKLEGRQGFTTWTMVLPELPGPFGAAVERRVRRSADEGVARLAAEAEADDDVASSVDVHVEVTRDDGRTVQARLLFSFYAQGAAHPLNEVSTVVVARPDAAPVLLTDVLTDTAPALEAALRHASLVAKQEGRDDPADRLSIDVDNWADWQAGPDGMTFFFDDYKAGGYASGLRDLNVPWSIVRPWVQDDAYKLLGPA